MSWSDAGDVLHRWAAVFLFGIVFFRFAFEVAILPNLLVLLAGCLVAGTLRRRVMLLWALGTALVMSGIWGLGVTHGASDWGAIIRPEPFGQILLSLYILLGAMALVVVFKKLHS